MTLVRLLILVVFVLVSNCVECAKILAMFPTPAISHQVTFRPLIQELVKRGHQVVVVTPNPAFPPGLAPSNLTEIDVHDISYDAWEEILKAHDGNKLSIYVQVNNVFKKFTSTFELQVKTPDVQRILKDEGDTFDLIIVEAVARATLGLGHLLKKPIIQFSSAGLGTFNYNQFGAPVNPIMFPNLLNQRLYNLTWWEKSMEFAKYVFVEYCMKYVMEDYDHAMVKRNFGADTPSFDELFEKYVHIVFANEHPIWAENRPVPPNIVYIGGIHQPADTKLPEDLEIFLNSSKNGVIYVSFGTSVRTSNLPLERIKMMTKVFSELPYDILWKWDQDEMTGRPENVRISKWVPQAQLLNHPNIKLFITQGGLQSTDELINAAVPVIGIPMLGDQWYNTEKYVHHGIGLQLDINTLDEATFRTAVNTVLMDKSYKNNALRLRKLIRKYPIEPLDLAVWWTEYVLENGALHFRSPAFNKSMVAYYEVPLIVTVLAALVLCMAVVFLVVRSVVRLLVGLRTGKKIKTA